MEADMETPPKKPGHRIYVLRQETLDNVIKARGETVEAKHLIKSRLTFESSNLQHMEKHKNSTLKIVENASCYPVLKKFNEKYMVEIQKSIVLQQSIVSKLGEAGGPHEIIKEWLDAPNTKNKPEELKKQLAAFYAEHKSKIRQLKKETKILRDLKDQLELSQDKLRNLQAATKRDFERDMVVSARQMKELKSLKGKEQELISHRDKSVQTWRELMIEEKEIRQRLQKGMKQISAEIRKFDKERVKVTNDAMTKFAQILNQQEEFRDDKRNATLGLVAEVTPEFMTMPKAVPISKENANCILYKFPDFAERLREIGFSEETTSFSTETTTAPVVKPDGSSNEDTKTETSSSKHTNDDSAKQSTSKDPEYSSTKLPSPEDTKNHSTKSTANHSDEKECFHQENRNTAQTQKEEISTTHRSKKKVSSQLVEDVEKPKRKLPKPPEIENSEYENDKTAHAPKQVWASSDEEEKEEEKEKEVSVNNSESEIEPDKPEEDETPPISYGVALDEPSPRVALVVFTATENTFLSFKKGQKVVQTHTANEEGLVYGYTRKHAYSQIRYGYFRIQQTRPWKTTPKNVVRNLFRNI